MIRDSQARSKRYYDEFSATYEDQRHRGYHALLDDLELEIALRHCDGGRVLEAGCGTGLILARLRRHCRHAVGIDLSAGMLAAAAGRRLQVVQGAVGALPFPDDCFDAVVSFKVLAHVPDIEDTLAELSRVTRPGGHLVLEFYNPHSLRALVKRLKRPSRIGARFSDEDVYTRFDSLARVRALTPPGLELVDLRGVRIFTPFAQLHDLPGVGWLLAGAERLGADLPLLRRIGGFLIVVLRKL